MNCLPRSTILPSDVRFRTQDIRIARSTMMRFRSNLDGMVPIWVDVLPSCSSMSSVGLYFAVDSPDHEPPVIHPERDTYYWITLESGAGFGSSHCTFDKAAIGDIEETIATSVDMYESTIDGFATMTGVEQFIELARKCFDAS